MTIGCQITEKKSLIGQEQAKTFFDYALYLTWDFFDVTSIISSFKVNSLGHNIK